MRNSSWTGIDAFAAAHAFRFVHGDGGSLRVYTQSVEWAGLDAWVIFTLGAQMRELGAWNQHENSDSGRFRPDFAFMAK